MRTRRSPRNQAILWRALGGPPAPPRVDIPPMRCADCGRVLAHVTHVRAGRCGTVRCQQIAAARARVAAVQETAS